jgi:hypothetical protein
MKQPLETSMVVDFSQDPVEDADCGERELHCDSSKVLLVEQPKRVAIEVKQPSQIVVNFP